LLRSEALLTRDLNIADAIAIDEGLEGEGAERRRLWVEREERMR
jgi:hypothetical protein